LGRKSQNVCFSGSPF